MKTPAAPSLNHSIAHLKEEALPLCTALIQLEASTALTGKVKLHLHCPVIFMFAYLLSYTFLWGTGDGSSAVSLTSVHPRNLVGSH